jgi:hypothetical protein
LVARLLWEQDAAGSNPVSPMPQKVSPQLTSPPLRKGRFFDVRAGVRGHGVVSAQDHIALTTRLLQQWLTGIGGFKTLKPAELTSLRVTNPFQADQGPHAPYGCFAGTGLNTFHRSWR